MILRRSSLWSLATLNVIPLTRNREHVTGFSKRKQQRKVRGMQQQIKRQKLEILEKRRERRQALDEDAEGEEDEKQQSETIRLPEASYPEATHQYEDTAAVITVTTSSLDQLGDQPISRKRKREDDQDGDEEPEQPTHYIKVTKAQAVKQIRLIEQRKKLHERNRPKSKAKRGGKKNKKRK